MTKIRNCQGSGNNKIGGYAGPVEYGRGGSRKTPESFSGSSPPAGSACFSVNSCLQKSNGSSALSFILTVFLCLMAIFAATTTLGCDNGLGKGDEIIWVDANGDGYDDKTGFDKDGFDRKGFDKNGLHKDTQTKFDNDGFDKNGFDKEGYNKNGYNKNGFDRDGHDADGYDLRGFDKDGIHRITGCEWDTTGKNKAGARVFADKDGDNFDDYSREYKTLGGGLYDEDGFDYQSYNERGFHKTTKLNKTTGKTYDALGYDIDNIRVFVDENNDGYDDISGLDKNGFENLKLPALENLTALNDNFTNNNAYARIGGGRGVLNRNATTLENAFNDHASGRVLANVGRVYSEATVTGETTGDWIAYRALINIAKYLNTIIAILPDEQAKYAKLIETYQTQSYVDYRAYGDKGASSQTELDNLYNQLKNMGIDTKNNIKAYFAGTVIPDLSVKLDINPGLLTMLFSQCEKTEEYYAIIDDVRAKGFRPVVSSTVDNNYYSQTLDTRSIAYVQQRIMNATLAQPSIQNTTQQSQETTK